MHTHSGSRSLSLLAITSNSAGATIPSQSHVYAERRLAIICRHLPSIPSLTLSFTFHPPHSCCRRPGADNRPAQGAAGKKAKWKQQSDQLRSAMAASRMLKEAAARGEDIRNVALPPTAEEDDDRCVLGCVLVQVTNRVLSPRKSFGCVNIARDWLGCACWDQRKKELRPWCQSLEGMTGRGRVSPCVLTFDLGSFDVACCCSSLQGALPLLRPQVRPAHGRPPHPTLQEHQGQAKHAQGRRGRAGAAQALKKWVMRSGM